MGEDVTDEFGTTTKLSPLSVDETVEKFLAILRSKGLKLFAVIDQRAEARSVGLDLRETVLIIFGNPASGTPVMQSTPLAALDLPLKLLIWADGAQTNVSYAATDSLMVRYRLAPELRGNLSGVAALTDVLVSAEATK
jgi:uncharacterized protein (DUF302 family)